MVRRFESGGTMSQSTGWEPPDTGARRPADPNLYGAYPPPPPGFAPAGPLSGPHPRPPMPASVVGAVRLMWLAVVMTAVQTVVVCSVASAGTGFGRYYLISGGAFVESNDYRTTGGAITFLLISGLVFCGLWIWMLTMCRLGRQWARIVSSVFFGLSVLSATSLVRPGIPGFDLFLGITITLVGLMVVILLWVPDSTPYFRTAPAPVPMVWGYPAVYPGHPAYPAQPAHPAQGRRARQAARAGQAGQAGQPEGPWVGSGDPYRR